VVLLLVVGCAVGQAPAAKPELEKLPGFFDCAVFKEIGDGDEPLRVEINLSGPLLDVITRSLGEELGPALGGLEALHAVILQLDGEARARARETITKTRGALEKKGWQQLAIVREESSEVNVLVLADGEVIRGLLVLVIDADEGEVVCANVAGVIDLAALELFADEIDIPGLDEVDLE
jgi:hypothetical protein